MPWILELTVACSVGLLGCAGSARAQDGSSPPDRIEPPAVAEGQREVHPSFVQRAAKHRTHFIRTPDGVFWDLWGEQEYVRVFNRSVRKVRRQTGLNPDSNQGGPRPFPRTWDEWVASTTRDARAWGLDEPVSSEEGVSFWTRKPDGQPPLWHSQTKQELPFVYLNTTNPDVRTRDEDAGATRVSGPRQDGTYIVSLRHGRGLESVPHVDERFAQPRVIAQVDDPRWVRNKQLAGEFILWPDETIETKSALDLPKYRYIAIEDLRPTTEELVRAVEQGDAVLAPWSYRIVDDEVRWEQREFPIEYKQQNAAPETQPDRGEPGERAPKATAIPITHVLVLRDGRRLDGQLIADDGAEVRFLVVVGSISGEQTYARSLVAEVLER